MAVTRKSRSPEVCALGSRAADPLETVALALGPVAEWRGRRLCLAFSGGLDSTALLRALQLLRPRYGFSLLAAHVHHGLQAAADEWAGHCARVAQQHGADFTLLHARLPVQPPGGIEAAARMARYQLLDQVECDLLLLAHHRDDQAESVLLALLRGAGPAGLAAMASDQVPAAHPLQCRVLRPWLGVDRSTLAAWARTQALDWIEDPSNADPRMDRSFLRTVVGPALTLRFPGWRAALARSAHWAAEAQALLDELAEQDLAALDCGARADPACLAGLAADYLGLSAARCRNLLRHQLAARGVLLPPGARLAEWVRQLGAAPDRVPELVWGDCVLRRWGGRLWLERRPPRPASSAPEEYGWQALPPDPCWDGQTPARVRLPDGSVVEFRSADASAAPRLSLRHDCGPLHLAPCTGSASLQLRAGGPHRRLRNLHQEAGVPPWRRARMPGLFSGGRLVGVAGLALDCTWAADAGSPAWQVLWHDAALRPGDK
jgi:tRNA(Ile)-lysidine synthase